MTLTSKAKAQKQNRLLSDEGSSTKQKKALTLHVQFINIFIKMLKNHACFVYIHFLFFPTKVNNFLEKMMTLCLEDGYPFLVGVVILSPPCLSLLFNISFIHLSPSLFLPLAF